MAEITAEIRKASGRIADLVPAPVLKAISTGELLDRVREARDLAGLADDPAAHPALRDAYRTRARAILEAQPRAATEAQIAKLAFQKVRTKDPARVAALQGEIARILELHPIAPERAGIAKAAAPAKPATLMPVHDAAGKLIGVCDPGEVTPLVPAKTPPAEVAKSDPKSPRRPGTPHGRR
jgi:hypothetical protein